MCWLISLFFFFFFFNDTATTEIYTLSLHDALPISLEQMTAVSAGLPYVRVPVLSKMSVRQEAICSKIPGFLIMRSEEHTSELQSRLHLVCRLLLEKKKKHHIK